MTVAPHPCVTPPADLGADLAAAHRLSPYLWASFYQRARMVQMRPAPVAPFLNVEITRRCCFSCSFCLAADRRTGPADLDPERLEQWLPSLRGLERVVLLGGEPLLHPGLPRILAAIRAIGARAEIYTNGHLLGRDADAMSRRLVELGRQGRGRSGPGIVTLAVDRPHREQLGAARLGKLLLAARAAQQRGEVVVRYNVTDPRIESRRYLSPMRAERILGELHPDLAEILREAIAATEVASRFDFNPVVGMGRAATAEFSGGELLRGSDLLDRLELSAAMDASGALRVYTLLNALWFEPRVEALCHGVVNGSDASRARLRAALRAEVLAPALGLCDGDLPELAPLLDWLLGSGDRAASAAAVRSRNDPTLSAALQTLEQEPEDAMARSLVTRALRSRDRYRRLARWAQPDALDDAQRRLLAYLLEDRGPAVALSDFFFVPRLPLGRLRPVVRRYHQRFPERRHRLMETLAARLARASGSALLAISPDAADHWEAPVPAAQASVDTGTSPLPSARTAQRLRPRWVATPGAPLSLEIEGLLTEQQAPAASRRDWVRVLEALAAALPPEDHPLLAAEIRAAGGGPPEAALDLLETGASTDGDARRSLVEDDPARVFEALTYEPNQHHVPWDDPGLAALVAAHGLPGWAPEHVATLEARLGHPGGA